MQITKRSIFQYFNEFFDLLSVLFEEGVRDQIEDASTLEYVFAHGNHKSDPKY